MSPSVILRALGLSLAVIAGLHAAQQAAPVHVLKISSGPSGGEMNGVYALASERSIFSRRDDREIIVLFQWDGVAGPHRLLAQWRSPDSAVTSNSAVDYVARAPRFGAYWSLPLSSTMTLGTWSIEATVDGVPAGRLTFEVTDNAVDSSPRKATLTPAELYERLNRALVVLQRSSKAKRALGATAGFSPAPGLVYTSMSSLDSADDIRVGARDGTAVPVTDAVAWNRQQHWAVLKGTTHAEVLPIAGPETTKVGTRCVSLEGSPTTGRVLSECSITGQNAPGAAPSLMATFSVGSGVSGAPVLNESGEVIGIIGDLGRTGERATVYDLRGTRLGTPIVPIGLIRPVAGAAPVPLADLRSRGVTVPDVVGDEHINTAGFGRVDAKGKLISQEHHDELSLREKAFAVFLTWAPKERLRGQMVVRLFDADNRLVAESKAAKVDFRRDQITTSSWSLPMVASPGTYRADVFLEAVPIWRGFVRIAP
jgi:S1-C subfamily serine protease